MNLVLDGHAGVLDRLHETTALRFGDGDGLFPRLALERPVDDLPQLVRFEFLFSGHRVVDPTERSRKGIAVFEESSEVDALLELPRGDDLARAAPLDADAAAASMVHDT